MAECVTERGDLIVVPGGDMLPQVAVPAKRGWNLKRVLVLSDAWAVVTSWGVVLGLRDESPGPVAEVAVLVAIGILTLIFLKSQNLYLARVSRLRSEELSRLARVSLLVGCAVYLSAGRLPLQLEASHAALGALASFGLLACSRSAYGSWLRSRRRLGLQSQPVVIVGGNEEGIQLRRLLDSHPELGLKAVAIADTVDAVMPSLRRHGARSVVVAVSAFGRADLNGLTRRLLDAGVHVNLSCGLAGIDYRRLRPAPMAREPLFYLEQATTSTWQRVASRTLDIVGSIVGLVITLPVLLAAAIAIKLHDRGPVLFSHERIGQNGRPFRIYKLRTMVPNAERSLALVAAGNHRDGPLFKATNDPRVTRIGRLLRATSIDELPQLVNVLQGKMSLVGPRPALAAEVAQFDEELLIRHRVRPGITGLWQVEARNDPAFESYRRLDLYYLENWSLMFDLVILVATVKGLLAQAFYDFRGKWREVSPPLGPELRSLEASSTVVPVL